MGPVDPWSRSVLTPSPSLDSYSDEDRGPNISSSTFVNVRRVDDHVATLDLTRRDDRAVVKQNPFTMASSSASRKKGKTPMSNNKSTVKVGSSIMTAEDFGKPISEKARSQAKRPAQEPAAFLQADGWTNGRGEPLPSSAPTKKRGTSSASEPRPKKVAKAQSKSTAKSKPLEQKKVANESKKDADRITFRCLRMFGALLSDNTASNVSPTKRFPIVAGLERQKQLPRRKSSPTACPAQESPAQKPKRPLLDVEALVTGRSAALGVRQKTAEAQRAASPVSSELSDIAAALAKQPPRSITRPKRSRRVLSPKPSCTPKKVPTASRPPATEHPIKQIDAVNNLPVLNDHRTPRDVEVSSSDCPWKVEAKDVVSVIHGHSGDPPIESHQPTRVELTRPVPVRPSVVSKLEALVAEQTYANGTADRDLDRRPRQEGTLQTHQQQRNGHLTHIISPEHRQAREHHRRLTAMPDMKLSPVSPSLPPDTRSPVYCQAPYRPTATDDYNQDLGSRGNSHRAYRAEDEDQHHYEHDTIPQRNAPSPHWSSHARRVQPVNTTNHAQNWHQVLQPDDEWTTIKKPRLTMAPRPAPMRSSTFRMPLKPFATRQTLPQTPSSSSSSPTKSPAVRVSVWSPTKPRQVTTHHEDAYVPPAIRALTQARKVEEMKTPARSARTAYPTPATSRRYRSSPGAEPNSDESDWAAAWALSGS